jgi:DNA repair protein RecO (recombination protein O)
MRLLDLLGFRPNLFTCVECGKPIEPVDQYFSAIQGGVRCPKCGPGSGSRPVSMKTLRYLRHLQRSTYKLALKLIPPDPIKAEMEALLNSYLTFLLERGLNSTAFIREVRDQKYL